MMGYADRERGLLARSRAFRTKPGFGGQHEAGRALPRHKSRHKRKRPLALFGLVRIELCEDQEIAVRRENAPGGNDLVTVARDRQATLQIRQHQIAQERHDDSLEIVLWLTL
jgi:hypothetical protein